MPWDPPGGARGSVRGEGSLGVPAQAAAPAARPWISGRKWMDGWTYTTQHLIRHTVQPEQILSGIKIHYMLKTGQK